MEELAMKIIDYLSKKKLFDTVWIYANDKRFCSDEPLGSHPFAKKETAKGTVYFEQKNISVKEYLSDADRNTLSIAFEGPLYNVINYHDFEFLSKMAKKLKIEEKFGLHFELGDAWNATLYS